MKMEICNLGAVQRAEIDLKPLTIFVGPNNTGKTWVAYILAGIFGPHGLGQYTKSYTVDEALQAYPHLNTALQQLIDEGNAKINLIQFADEYGERYINDVALTSKHWMQEFMSTERASFENLTVDMKLAEVKDRFLKNVKYQAVDRRLAVGRERALLNAVKETEEAALYFYTEGNISEKAFGIC